MSIEEILAQARRTWGDKPMTLAHIALAAEVVAGDIARQARNDLEGRPADKTELQKELGNLISSAIRWCDDLGFDPGECVLLSQNAQEAYVAKTKVPNG